MTPPDGIPLADVEFIGDEDDDGEEPRGRYEDERPRRHYCADCHGLPGGGCD